jgi:5-methylcytosine-specific restriction protein A
MMPTAIKRHLPALLKPRYKTLAERNARRTLALNGATWRKLRATVLREQPMCPVCEAEGKLVPAVDVDHIDNDASNNARDNLMGLCRPHHSVKTNVDHYGRRVRGCDVNGIPLDPDHAWNVEKSPATDSHEPTCSSHAHRRTCEVPE